MRESYPSYMIGMYTLISLYLYISISLYFKIVKSIIKANE